MEIIMKKLTRAIALICVTVILLSAYVLPAFAAGEPAKYSTSANSGTRDVLCTTLSGTSAASYYTGSYTYESLSGLSSGALLSSLRTLMTSTHKKITSYSNCRDYEGGNSSNITTLYTSYSTSHSQYNSGNGWNREHVWPKSLGGFDEEKAGADLHHIRPSENHTNSQRGNLKYGNASGGTEIKGNLSSLPGGYKGSYYEPLDNVKGDVARICLYVYVRWGDEYYKCSNINNVFQSVDVLLEWCELDPVDTWEMGRNEVVASIQGNRNVFIDYPELAWTLFGEEVPEGMSTPSRGSAGGSDTPDVPDTPDTPDVPNIPTGPCTHTSTVIVNAKDATCIDFGYTGDTVCADCGEVISTGDDVPYPGHYYGKAEVITQPTEDKPGISRKVCVNCGEELLDFIPKLEKNYTVVIVVGISVGVVAVGGVTAFIAIKKKRG